MLVILPGFRLTFFPLFLLSGNSGIFLFVSSNNSDKNACYLICSLTPLYFEHHSTMLISDKIENQNLRCYLS